MSWDLGQLRFQRFLTCGCLQFGWRAESKSIKDPTAHKMLCLFIFLSTYGKSQIYTKVERLYPPLQKFIFRVTPSTWYGKTQSGRCEEYLQAWCNLKTWQERTSQCAQLYSSSEYQYHVNTICSQQNAFWTFNKWHFSWDSHWFDRAQGRLIRRARSGHLTSPSTV